MREGKAETRQTAPARKERVTVVNRIVYAEWKRGGDAERCCVGELGGGSVPDDSSLDVTQTCCEENRTSRRCWLLYGLHRVARFGAGQTYLRTCLEERRKLRPKKVEATASHCRSENPAPRMVMKRPLCIALGVSLVLTTWALGRHCQLKGRTLMRMLEKSEPFYPSSMNTYVCGA